MKRCRFQRACVAALMAGLLCAAGGGAVRIVHPAEDEAMEFIPDIPLWVRLEKGEGECFAILLDGEYETITCEADTILSAKPRPGLHRIEVVPTDAHPSPHGPIASASFHVYRDHTSNIIPPQIASADG